MTEPIKRLHYDNFDYGDIVRLTRAVPGSSGKRFKFLGAVFESEDSAAPIYLDLVEIGRGQMRAIRPEHVIKDVVVSKAAQARTKRKKSK